MLSLEKRLIALEQSAHAAPYVVAFGVDDEALARMVAEAKVVGQRVVRWPLPPPPVELNEQEKCR